MPSHELVKGRIIIYGEWTGSEYVEHQAYVRAIVGMNHPFHTEVNLTYSNGNQATPINNILNIEQITGNEDYWRNQDQPNINDSIPRTVTRPTQGDIVWLTIWDDNIQDDMSVLAFVRSIPGPPQEPEPNLNLSFYDPVADDAGVLNNVAPWAGTGGSTLWFDQQ